MNVIGLIVALVAIGATLGCAGGPEDPQVVETAAGTLVADLHPMSTEEIADRLVAADQALRNSRYSEAIEGYQQILSTFDTSSPTIELIRSSLLEAEYLSKDYDSALQTSQEILDGDPSAETIARALQRRYDIGLSFLGGATRRVLGLSVSAEGKGLQVLDDLVEKYPFQPFADDAVYHIASWYLDRGKYPEAEQLFQRLLRDYPTSPWSQTAEYRIGEAALRRLKGVEYDFGTLDSAERRFRRYLKLSPAGDQAARARESLAEIEKLRAERWLMVAQFYIAFEKVEAARVYLRKLRENQPNTAEGRRAAELWDNLGGGSDATP